MKTADGKDVEVTTVFELTKELCNADYTPEKVQEITGVHAGRHAPAWRAASRNPAPA